MSSIRLCGVRPIPLFALRSVRLLCILNSSSAVFFLLIILVLLLLLLVGSSSSSSWFLLVLVLLIGLGSSLLHLVSFCC